jgi:predicted glutamine amidotransferase
MCRLLGYCSRDHASLASLLGEQGLGDFTALSALHSDGWGMAWYDEREPVIRKSPGRADSEPDYDKLAWQPVGGLGLLHLRWATPGLPVASRNSHPFRYGPYVLAHNGAIHPQDRLGELLPPEWERQLTGTTDSERYFLHLMWRLAERGGDMIAAIADTTADIERRYAPNSLNAVLLSPDKLYVISWHDPAKVPARQLATRGYGNRPDEVAAYFDLAYRASADAVVVASSGWPMAGWTPLPRRHVLVTDRATLATSVLPLAPGSPPATTPALGVRAPGAGGPRALATRAAAGRAAVRPPRVASALVMSLPEVGNSRPILQGAILEVQDNGRYC